MSDENGIVNEIIGEDGSFVENWRENLSEDIREDKTLANLKNFNDMAKMVVDGQKTIGKKGVIIPGEDASDEEMNAFHTSMGRPEKATDYEFTKQELPEGMEFDEKMDTAFREFAHKSGYSQKQAAGASDWYNKTMIDAHNANNKAITENQAEAMTSLKKIWGKDTPANMELAEKAFKTYVPDEAKQKMFGKFGDEPILIEAFLAVGKGMSEDSNVGSGGAVGVDAKAEIEKIKLDPKHAFNIANDAAHDKAVKDMHDLYLKAYPDTK